MGGAIVISDEKEETPVYLWEVSCPTSCQHDIILMLQPVLVYADKNGRGYSQMQKNINDSLLFRYKRFLT